MGNNAIISLCLDKNIGDFIKILNRCRNENIGSLFIKLNNKTPANKIEAHECNLKKKFKFITNAYNICSKFDTNLGLYFLLHNHSTIQVSNAQNVKEWDTEQILKETPIAEFKEFSIRNRSGVHLSLNKHTLHTPISWDDKNLVLPDPSEGVVLGGTFDRLHNGHRYLLTIACLMSRKVLGVGITDSSMLKNKLLSEMIESIDVRENSVRNYINLCNPELELIIDHLKDAVGFSGTSQDFKLLITSEETEKGIEIVNEVRLNNNLPPLENLVVDSIIPETDGQVNLENSDSLLMKISSSNKRWDELGTIRKPIIKPFTSYPYLIGLTGQPCSGKSSISQRFEKKGAYLIDCDIEAHHCYRPGTACYKEIIEKFGTEILSSTEDTSSEITPIHRKKLGAIVFGDDNKLDLLCSIVWPKLRERITEIVDSLDTSETKVCVIEAAVMFEAKLQDFFHEIWFCSLPPRESVKRLITRNNLTQDEAMLRVNSFARSISNFEKASQSHVILSTYLHPGETDRIFDKSWKLLQNRLVLNS